MKQFKLLFLLFFCSWTMAKEVRIVALDYPPYYSPSLYNQGFMAEIIIEAFKASGHEVRIEYLPWARAVRQAELGEADALMAVWHSEARERQFHFSNPLPGNELVFYRKVGTDYVFNGWEGLKRLRIGGVNAYTYPDYLKQLNLELTGSDLQNLQKLALARVDLIIIDRSQALYLLGHQAEDIKGAVEPIFPAVTYKPQYIGFPKSLEGSSSLLMDFNLGLIKITESGSVSKIRKKHGY